MPATLSTLAECWIMSEVSNLSASNPPNAQLVGIDVGGTFTDFVWLVDGRLQVHKESTTPGNQSEAILKGLQLLGVSKGAGVVHGTTVATNALLERRGAKTALLTTRGFADVLAIGRQNRPHLYKLGQFRQAPLVPASLRFEATERVDASGNIVEPLSSAGLSDVAAQLRREKVESLAIVFLFSFLNTKHEKEAAQILQRELEGIHFSISSELLPEYREYERTATTVINAYVQPLVARYLFRLKSSLGGRSVRVMQSSGGAIDLDKAAEHGARLVLSGPAGGIVGAFEMARLADGALGKPETAAPQIITFDMGGTSTDVALCPGKLPRTSESEISDLPLRFPSTDIHTVGAGGGSIARVDAGGVLRVGPESAGARPGPACYNRGGEEATVTDANLVLGRLKVDGFLGGGGGLSLNIEKAETAMLKVARKLDVSIEQAALGIVRVANATMERALRKVSVEKGHDPRDYTMVPFGGAGPLHACELAEALDVRRIMVPKYPGVLSALGLLLADITYDASASILKDLVSVHTTLDNLAARIEELSARVTHALSGHGSAFPAIEATLDMRYRGQSYELEVGLPLSSTGSAELPAENLDKAVAKFHRLHQQRYGYCVVDGEVEIVTLRVKGRLPGAQPELPSDVVKVHDADEAMTREVEVWFDQTGSLPIPCYDRALLKAGRRLKGPCVVFQYDTTLVVTGLWEGEVDGYNNIILWRMA